MTYRDEGEKMKGLTVMNPSAQSILLNLNTIRKQPLKVNSH